MTRVYAPTTARRLRAALVAGSLSAPLRGHAVTAAVRAALPEETEEDREHAVSEVAAQASVALLAPDEPARRMVVALDVGAVAEVPGDDATAVEVGEDVPLHRLAAVMCDDPGAEAAVSAARDAAPGSPDADGPLDHQLGWWATQELDVLLDGLA